MQTLTWTGPIRYPGMLRFQVPADGSCLFHSLLFAYNQNYRLEGQNGRFVSWREIVKKLRQELSNLLASPIDPLVPSSRRYYDIIARGHLEEISKSSPQYTLKNMQKTLDSNAQIDDMYLEFIADALDKDIYILSEEKQDIYLTGKEDLYQKGRSSIVLLYGHDHYTLIGNINGDSVTKTLFNPKEDFITRLKIRQAQLVK